MRLFVFVLCVEEDLGSRGGLKIVSVKSRRGFKDGIKNCIISRKKNAG